MEEEKEEKEGGGERRREDEREKEEECFLESGEVMKRFNPKEKVFASLPRGLVARSMVITQR